MFWTFKLFIISSRHIKMHLKWYIKYWEVKKRRHFIANIRSASIQLSGPSYFFITFQYAKIAKKAIKMLSIAIIFLTIRTFFQQFFGTITIKVAKSEIFTNDVKNINWIDAFLHPPLQSILSCLSNFMFFCCK